MGNLNNIEEIRKNMECLEGEDQILLYVNHDVDLEDVIFCMKEVFPEADFTGESQLQDDEEWKVYLIERN